MQQTLSSLLALQDIDRHLFKVQKELQRLPKERQRRQEILDRKQKEIDELRARAFELKARVKEIEEVAIESRARIRKVESAAATARGDASLHANYEHEVRSLKRDIARGEEEALSFIEKMETCEAEAKERETALKAEQAVFDEFSANVDAELADAQARHDDLAGQRQQRMSSELDAETLELYSRLLEARGGDAMAELDGRICQGCYMEIPANLQVRLLRGAEIVQCPSCDRILYPA